MVRCPFPYISSNLTTPDACDQTIADAGGTTYKIFMGIWLTGILIIIIITIIQFICLLRIRGYSLHEFKTSYLHQIYCLSLYNLFTLLVRMIDPMNYAGRINYTFFRVMKDTSSWATYGVVVLTVCSWVKIMYQISGRSRHNIILGERIIIIVTFWMCLFFGILQPQVEKGYIVYAVQMFLFAIYDACVLAIAWMHGLRVYCHLSRFELPTNASTTVSRQAAPITNASSPTITTPTTPLRAPPSASTTTTPPPPTTTTTTRPSKSSRPKQTLQQKKSRVIILLKLICVMTMCVCAAGAFQIYTAVQALKEKYHHIHNPEPYPTWKFGDMLSISGLSIVSTLCSIFVLIFARKFGSDPRDQSSTDVKVKSHSDPHTRLPKTPIADVTSRRISKEHETKRWSTSCDIGKHTEMISSSKPIAIINSNNKYPSTSTLLSQIGSSGRSSESIGRNEVGIEISTPHPAAVSTHPPAHVVPVPVPLSIAAQHPFQTATTSMDDITLEMEVATTNHATL